ncbi:MCE family protein [Nocardia yunnanensis]|uniref:MCE family protein n=1 Tax=Nocardia yunnanensis TaxID=2382165 RepID=A0A386ZAX9_9NOCA|nr:MCE family protein [Nocardia yunnanensis]AYF74831.1 MCE family protein [Nocardia yunnanensis]
MKRPTLRGLLIRLGVFAAVMGVLLAVVITAITRPVNGRTDGYSADFSDASGLKSGDDVRMYGVQVGKVTGIELRGTQARVGFSVQSQHPIYADSVLAIRYQSLTGQRYIDVRQPDSPGARLSPGTTIGADWTVPSFDITQLFNGLQPVLQEFSPGALNKFAESVLAVVQGDGNGIGPALDAFEQLSRYVTDRQTVLSAIVSNLRSISNQIGGKSPYLITLLHGLADVFTVFQDKVDGLLQLAAVTPSTLAPLNDIMTILGLTVFENPSLDRDVRLLFPDPQAALDLLGKLPGLLQSLSNLLPPADVPPGQLELSCSKGAAQVPAPLSILVAGQRISICNG